MSTETRKMDSDRLEGPPLWRVLLLVVVVISVGWLIAFLIFYSLTNGKYDESFNGTNSLFSALAFGGVITAIFLQRRELELQRWELIDTRAVLQKQQDQLESQTQAFEKQNFESTFFSLINLHHTIVNSMTASMFNEERQGRDCFELFYKDLKLRYSNAKRQLQPSEADEDILLETIYLEFFQRRQSSIGHYFRNLYNIVRFIQDSQVKDKWVYIRLVRAQLSVFELSMLFYNCISPPGRGFQPLVEKFALLKTVEDKDILDTSHRRHYKSKAFGNAEP